MKIIGLTGPTGSGKSSVAVYLEEKGMPFIEADKYARIALLRGSECLERLCVEFGNDILDNEGNLNRGALAAKAFSSREKTDLLNKITHPYIIRLIDRRLDEFRRNGTQAVILDAPQLFESGADALCDLTVAVLSDEENRLKRIMSRDNIDADAAVLRMSAGKDDDFYTARADRIIYNNSDKAAMFRQADEIAGI